MFALCITLLFARSHSCKHKIHGNALRTKLNFMTMAMMSSVDKQWFSKVSCSFLNNTVCVVFVAVQTLHCQHA